MHLNGCQLKRGHTTVAKKRAALIVLVYNAAPRRAPDFCAPGPAGNIYVPSIRHTSPLSSSGCEKVFWSRFCSALREELVA